MVDYNFLIGFVKYFIVDDSFPIEFLLEIFILVIFQLNLHNLLQ